MAASPLCGIAAGRHTAGASGEPRRRLHAGARCDHLGVVANVWRFQEDGREILGFISYGYAQMLLRLDRIEEFLLFLYSHRYHAHTRGSWTAGEVTGITGDSGTYCVPAQQTFPLLVRWMLVLEDSDDEILYFAKGVPREWVGSGKRFELSTLRHVGAKSVSV